MKEYQRNKISKENRQAWDALYSDTKDLIWGAEPVGFLPEFCADIRSRLKSHPRGLDAATGEGRNLRTLLEWGMDVSACDASPHALDKLPPDVRSCVRPVIADLYCLPFQSARFDFVLASDIIETLPSPERGLREIVRVLRPGGMLLCNIPGMEDGIASIDMNKIDENDSYLFRDRYFYQFLTEAQAEQLLAAAGFKVVNSRLCTWTEHAHPQFRDSEHQHTSRVFLAEKVLGAAA